MLRQLRVRDRAAGRRRPLGPAVAVLLLVGSGLTACSGDDGPEQALDAFLTGWRDGNLDTVGLISADGQKLAAAQVTADIKALSGELADSPPTLTAKGDPEVTADIATATVDVDWALPGGGRWTYPTTVRLDRDDNDAWRVIWEPTVVAPELTAGDELGVRRLRAPRASILDGRGEPIVTAREVVVVGVEPQKVVDVRALVRQLDTAFRSIRTEVDLSGLPKRVAEADPQAFIEVVTLRRAAYDEIRSRIRDLDGTVFRAEKRDLAPTRAFARALLGTVDPALREDIDRNPDKLVEGDLVGHGGLQQRYDDRLRGGVGEAVVIKGRAPDGAVQATEIFRIEPQPGAPVRTTLDVDVQNAADEALTATRLRAALVAVRISDGAVLAAANGPDGGTENLAFTAQVPPGSTFKVVSTLGLLDRGEVSLDQPVACPKTFTVDGRPFKNANNFALGTVPFRTNFARSCNTAFAALAPKLGPDGLAAAGATLGLGASWDLGVDAFSGTVSTGGSATERAAAAFGQGTTVVSPLAMAGAVAAVARGQFQQPNVLLDPAPATPAAVGPQLAATSVQPLRQMMREVVTKGSATELADVPGGAVYGKTGTAEYDDNPAHTHAWFVGWQNDVAFAVFVEEGGSSSATAVPVAERFLRALPRS